MDEDETLNKIIDIIYKAGEIAINIQKNEILNTEKKLDGTFVCQGIIFFYEFKGDVIVNNFIFKSLTELKLKDIYIIGEESEKNEKLEFSKGKYIFFDPVLF
jgi:3'-phosphoadenosine 5'-phosphosulfate (PAPS) 3'-phosphatase